MDQNQPITTYRRDLFNLLKKADVSWEVHYGEKYTLVIFLIWGCMFIAKRGNGCEEIAGSW